MVREALNPLDASDKRYLTTFKSNCSEFYNELFQEFIFCLLFFEGLFYSDVVWMQK